MLMRTTGIWVYQETELLHTSKHYNVPPPVMFVGLDSPQSLVRYLRTINHSEIGVMCTN